MSSGNKGGKVSEKGGGGENCPECSSVVSKKDHGVGCEMCKKWFPIACVGIDLKVYEGLKQLNNLHWFCDTCNSHVDMFLTDIAKFEKKEGYYYYTAGNAT